jgi:ATP-dependent DNA ligase
MSLIKRIVKTGGWILYDNIEDILNMAFVPWAVKGIANKIGVVGSEWLLSKAFGGKGIDGIILSKVGLLGGNYGAKFAIRKGLPILGQRRLAVENEPHALDGFNGIIDNGYGKGTKRIVFKGPAILKVKGQSQVTDIEYHLHNADRAGLHYDLAIRNLPSATDLFELNIGRGPVKGRYSFVRTDKGYVVGVMRDRGVSIPKPNYKLKPEESLASIDLKDFIVERKLDGSLINCLIHDDRVIMHSHRDNTNTYYDKLPSIEFIKNTSPYYSSRRFFPGPDLEGTILKAELIHRDGSSVVSGLLNSSPDNSVRVQQKIGAPTPFVWDIVRYRKKDVSGLSYSERRELFEECVNQIRLFNRNWNSVERCVPNVSPLSFYRKVIDDRRGLPWSEGVVIKAKSGIAEDSWIKVKRHDLIDMEILSFNPGEGRLFETLGSLECKDLETGNIAVVGTGMSDFQRDWIWSHRDMLEGAVIKTKVFEQTDQSFRAPRFIEFHESKGNNEAGLLLYADVLSGLDDKDKLLETKYKLINA